jgi:hypothetical protein
MPTHIRAMCQWQVGSALPADIMQITPCFRSGGVLGAIAPEWQTLADDLADALVTWTGVAKRQLTVKLYDIPATKPTPGDPDAEPNRPRATAIRDVGVITQTGSPREIALCLSFSGGPNAPWNRGRLYVPFHFTGESASNLNPRPQTSTMNKVLALGPIFADLGGVDIDWIVWSHKRWSATAVERYHVDDEWDVMRKRGLQPTTRVSGTTSEA